MGKWNREVQSEKEVLQNLLGDVKTKEEIAAASHVSVSQTRFSILLLSSAKLYFQI